MSPRGAEDPIREMYTERAVRILLYRTGPQSACICIQQKQPGDPGSRQVPVRFRRLSWVGDGGGTAEGSDFFLLRDLVPNLFFSP